MQNKHALHPRAASKLLLTLSGVQIAVFILLIAVVGTRLVHQSSATPVPVTGRVTKNGAGVKGVVIDGCNLNAGYGIAAVTDSNGNFTTSKTIDIYAGYCVRVAWTDYLASTDNRVKINKSALGSVVWPPSTNQRPEHSGSARYEFQVAGLNCYHAGSNYGCNPNGSEQTWDWDHENSFIFSFVSPPPPPPQPTPTPTPTPTPKPSPTPSSGGSKTSSGGGSGGSSAATAPDTSPPTEPGDFQASKNADTKTVQLSWQASTDDRGVSGYLLERSIDQQAWATLDQNVNGTDFEDKTAVFGQKYYYRVSAFDAAGNKSGYATADITTDDFSANVTSADEARITSDDDAITVVIAAGSTTDDLFCTLQTAQNELGPNIDGYQLAAGPYGLLCRTRKGDAFTAFTNPLSSEVQLKKLPTKDTNKLVYYGKNQDSWSKLKVSAQDKKARVDTVDFANNRLLAIMRPKHKTSPWVAILTILIVIVAFGAGIVLFLRFRQRYGLKQKYEDYVRKSRGY